MLTVTEAAVQLGVSTRRVCALIKAEKLKATKKAGVWDIDRRSLRALAAKDRKPGNPWKKRRPIGTRLYTREELEANREKALAAEARKRAKKDAAKDRKPGRPRK
jgi:excisionase family DNA binding protein